MSDKNRKWLPNIAELIDRLTIHQLKEVFLPEYKEKYAREMKDIMYDLDLLIQQKDIKLSSRFIRAVIIMSEINTHIWHNESRVRNGQEEDMNLLKLTHGLNGIRNRMLNFILTEIGEEDKKEWKTDCLAAEFKDWEISLK